MLKVSVPPDFHFQPSLTLLRRFEVVQTSGYRVHTHRFVSCSSSSSSSSVSSSSTSSMCLHRTSYNTESSSKRSCQSFATESKTDVEEIDIRISPALPPAQKEIIELDFEGLATVSTNQKTRKNSTAGKKPKQKFIRRRSPSPEVSERRVRQKLDNLPRPPNPRQSRTR